MIFVFGSNEAGIHGAGAALYAQRCRGAILGTGFGHAGDSFAIPTKDSNIETLPIGVVHQYIEMFLSYARQTPQEKFQVSAVGCGLAGFTHEQIAPMFADAPDNCWFDTLWKPVLGDGKKYWGTFNRTYTFTPEYRTATGT